MTTNSFAIARNAIDVINRRWHEWYCIMCGKQSRTNMAYIGVCLPCQAITNDDGKQDREDAYTGHPVPRRAS